MGEGPGTACRLAPRNRDDGPDRVRRSRAVELRLDEAAGTYETAWSYDGDQRLYTAFMGSAERLDDGPTLVGWSSGGRVELVDPDGRVAGRVDSAIGFPLGVSHFLPTLGERAP